MGLLGSTSKKSTVNNIDNRVVDNRIDNREVDLESEGEVYSLANSSVGGNVSITATAGEAFALADRALDSVVALSRERDQATTRQLEALESGIVNLKSTSEGSNLGAIPWLAGAIALVAFFAAG